MVKHNEKKEEEKEEARHNNQTNDQLMHCMYRIEYLRPIDEWIDDDNDNFSGK